MKSVVERPRLAGHVRRQVDRVSGVAMLLFPEGALELSDSADAVVGLCDGERSVTEIAAVLSERFDGVVEVDVRVVVEGLAERGLVVE